jgi:hypothetical protein
MTTEVELLPLPAENYVDDEGLWETRYGPYSSEQMKDYARANVARAVAPLQAEIEALRAEVEWLNRILGRIVACDGDSNLTIRMGADAFAAAREYLLRDQEDRND